MLNFTNSKTCMVVQKETSVIESAYLAHGFRSETADAPVLNRLSFS